MKPPAATLFFCLLLAVAGGSLFLPPPPIAAGPYYNLEQSASSATMRLSGVEKIAAGVSTWNTPTIILDGVTGLITATSFSGISTASFAPNYVLKSGDSMTGFLRSTSYYNTISSVTASDGYFVGYATGTVSYLSQGTGGTITTYRVNNSTYVVHTFTADGTFTPPAGLTRVRALVVGGGGPGGSGGGGGGGGQVLESNISAITFPTMAVVVGGTQAVVQAQGQTSSFGGVGAQGGGAGGPGGYAGGSGANGGGGGAGTTVNYAGGSALQGGHGGGAGSFIPPWDTGHGGGGGGAVAGGGNAAAVVTGPAGAGGDGLPTHIRGTAEAFGGGGGGFASSDTAVIALGGVGGGGNGGRLAGVSGAISATAGGDNTGGGGGGGGGYGAAGVVVLMYSLSVYPVQDVLHAYGNAVVDNDIMVGNDVLSSRDMVAGRDVVASSRVTATAFIGDGRYLVNIASPTSSIARSTAPLERYANWDSAHGWGDHAGLYLTEPATFTILTGTYLTSPATFTYLANPATFTILTGTYLTEPATFTILTGSYLTQPATFTILTGSYLVEPATFTYLANPATFTILTGSYLAQPATFYVVKNTDYLAAPATFTILTGNYLTSPATFTYLSNPATFTILTGSYLTQPATFTILTGSYLAAPATFTILTGNYLTSPASFTYLANPATFTILTGSYLISPATFSLTVAGGGDNFGSHIATQAVTINFPTTIGSSLTVRGVITTTSAANAAYYQIGGSTVIYLPAGSLVGNLAIGQYAGYNLSFDNYNTFIGYKAGYSQSGGADGNVFIGYESGKLNNSAGTFNIFIGYDSGMSNTSGAGNIFIGSSAGELNTTGAGNTFIGKSCGAKNTTGRYNLTFGYESFGSNTVGYANVALGYRSGSLGTSISSNTMIGYQAGYNLTGSDNTLIGWQSGYNITSGTGNIVIGYNKDTSGATASNELNIGGILTGNLNPGGGITVSTLTVTGSAFSVGASTLVVSGGKVGIGTANPGYPLDVVGNIYTTGDVGVGVAPTARVDIFPKIELGTNLGLSLGTYNAGTLPVGYITSNVYRDAGNVWKLKSSNSANLYIQSGYDKYFSWLTFPAGTAGDTITWSEKMRLTEDGNLGIGTTVPTSKLSLGDANTANYTNRIALNEESNGSYFYGISYMGDPYGLGLHTGHLNLSAPDLFIQATTGNVGISSTAPMGLLSMQTGAAGSYINAGSAQFTTTSGKSLKENIRYLSADSVKFSKLKPAKFNFKIHKSSTTVINKNVKVTNYWDVASSTLTYGMIAEDVAAAYPGQPTGEINWNFVNAQMILALQNALKRIEALEAKP